MSGGKHAQYAYVIQGSSGKGKELRIGGGTPDSPGPLVKHISQPASLADANATLSVDQMHGFLDITPTAQRTLTSPTAAQLIAAFPQLKENCYMDLYVRNAAAATHDVVMAGGTGVSPSPSTLEIRPLTTAHMMVVRTGATTFELVLLSDTGAST